MKIPETWYLPFDFEDITLLFVSIKSPHIPEIPQVRIRIKGKHAKKCPKIVVGKKDIIIDSKFYHQLDLTHKQWFRLTVFIQRNRDIIIKHTQNKINDAEFLKLLEISYRNMQ